MSRLVVQNPDDSVEIATEESHLRTLNDYANNIRERERLQNMISEIDGYIMNYEGDLDVFRHAPVEEWRNNPFTQSLLTAMSQGAPQAARDILENHLRELQNYKDQNFNLNQRRLNIMQDINAQQPIAQPRPWTTSTATVIVGLNLFRATPSVTADSHEPELERERRNLRELERERHTIELERERRQLRELERLRDNIMSARRSGPPGPPVPETIQYI